MRKSSFLFTVALILLLLADRPIAVAQGTVYTSTLVAIGVYVDSAWGFSFSLPEPLTARYHAREARAVQYDGFIAPQTASRSDFQFIVYRYREFISDLAPGDRPRFTSDPDTVKQMVSFLCHRIPYYTTAGSNVENRTDSIVERKTASGLRMFLHYATQTVDYKHTESGATSALAPTYYIAVPDVNDWTFVSLSGVFPTPSRPASKLKTLEDLAKSVKALHRQ